MKRNKSITADQSSEINAIGSYETYLEYNKILSTWFIAFGVGGPALLIANGNLIDRLVVTGNLRLVAMLFLIGVGLQVVGALTNKVANWNVHAMYTHMEAHGRHFK